MSSKILRRILRVEELMSESVYVLTVYLLGVRVLIVIFVKRLVISIMILKLLGTMIIISLD